MKNISKFLKKVKIELFLVFKETPILSAIVAVATYVPTNSVGGFPFLHTFSSI